MGAKQNIKKEELPGVTVSKGQSSFFPSQGSSGREGEHSKKKGITKETGLGLSHGTRAPGPSLPSRNS